MKRRDFIATLMFSTLAGFVPANAAETSKIKVGILVPLTGPFAAVAETQKQGALLAIDVINKRGGLNMPGGKVMVEGIVDDAFHHHLAAGHIEAAPLVDDVDRQQRALFLSFRHRRKRPGERKQDANLDLARFGRICGYEASKSTEH